MQPRNASRFFKHLAALLRFGRDNRADATLADQGRRMRACCCICEDKRNVLGAHIAAIGPVCGASAALDPAGDFQFLVGIIVGGIVAAFGQDGDFSEIARRA